jgi:hypothetical protein
MTEQLELGYRPPQCQGGDAEALFDALHSWSGTGRASAISGTPSAPKPLAKPLLDRPVSRMAGRATA